LVELLGRKEVSINTNIVLPNTAWFQAIVDWNKERGLDKLPFDLVKEVSFIFEEALESSGRYTSESAREKAQEMAEKMVGGSEADPDAVVDAFADMIVFAVGAMLKAGYDPSLVVVETFKAINSRTGKLIDGKFVKDPDVVRYEPDYSICKIDS
jgi:hypothetical protein